MLCLLFNLQNTTKYATSDLSRAFLEHYEKYKNQIKRNDNVYEKELHKLEEYVKTYTLYKSEENDIINEYKTTKICHLCKTKNETVGSKKIFKCCNKDCKIELGRDVNASINIYNGGFLRA